MEGTGDRQRQARIPSQVLRRLLQPLHPPEQTHSSPAAQAKVPWEESDTGHGWQRTGQSWQSRGRGGGVSRKRLPATDAGTKAFMSPACAISSLPLWLWGGRESSSACWCALVSHLGLCPLPLHLPPVSRRLQSLRVPICSSLSASAVHHLIFSTLACFSQAELRSYHCRCYHHRHYPSTGPGTTGFLWMPVAG